MIAGIQTLVYVKLLDPVESVLSWPLFGILSFITVILAGGGYVINDYFDIKTDSINKPDRMIAGRIWSLTSVKLVYALLIGLGVILSIFLAIKLNLLKYLFIYPLAVLGLWFYSYRMKCLAIIGNVWVAAFCAFVVGIVALPDIILDNSHQVKELLWYYMAFAFLSTWYREVIKDIEDVEGDRRMKCETVVVRYGLKAGKIIAIVLGLLLVASLLAWDSVQTDRWMKLGLNVLQGFAVASMAFVWWAKNPAYYHHASTITKLVMVGGTALLLLNSE
jgi:4-hydroxybenzoate polyprenyltransferase